MINTYLWLLAKQNNNFILIFIVAVNGNCHNHQYIDLCPGNNHISYFFVSLVSGAERDETLRQQSKKHHVVIVVVVGHLRTRLWWWWLCFVVYQGQSWYQHHLQQLCQVTAHGKGLSVLCHIFIVSLISLLEIWENPSKHTLQKVFSQTKENKKPFNIRHKKRWNLETCSFIRANTSEHSNVDSM